MIAKTKKCELAVELYLQLTDLLFKLLEFLEQVFTKLIMNFKWAFILGGWGLGGKLTGSFCWHVLWLTAT